ncbi:MAG: hypothetical protein CNLJKLNK_01397 [Holosporales bacterium]
MVNNDDKRMNISKKIITIIMKMHVSFVLFVLGHTVFTSVSLWAGIIFVIPGVSLLLLFCIKWIDDCFATDGSKITFYNNRQRYETKHNRQRHEIKHNFQSTLYKDYKRGYSSLEDRKNKYGY